ncbi:hypothetical protein BH10ACI3_BH10ACI3_28140 [soil metagenome]
MSFELQFDILRYYDSGESGITIPVVIELKTRSIQIPAKVDTGSSFCIFGRTVAQELEIEIESGNPKSISTATGTFVAYGHDVTLRTSGIEFDSEVFFVSNDGFHRNVLGRNGWLNRFVIGINDYDGELYLRPHNK